MWLPTNYLNEVQMYVDIRNGGEFQEMLNFHIAVVTGSASEIVVSGLSTSIWRMTSNSQIKPPFVFIYSDNLLLHLTLLDPCSWKDITRLPTWNLAWNPFTLIRSPFARVTLPLQHSEIWWSHFLLNCINWVCFVKDDVTYLFVVLVCRRFTGDSKAAALLSHSCPLCVSVKGFQNRNRVHSTTEESPN